MVLTIPVCTANARSDGTCPLGDGDHDFLHKPSFAAYYRLEQFKAQVLVEQEEKGVVYYRGMLDEKIFARVCAGVAASKESPPKYRTYFAEQTKKK